MKKLLLFVLICLGIVLISVTSGKSQVSAGISVGPDGLKSFYLAVGSHYNIPERAVLVVKQKRIEDEELPVVFYICQRAGIKPAAVIELRHLGKSWLDITLHFGLGPDIFYVPMSVDPGPPYGKAYGHFKKHPKGKWKEIQLTDTDIVNLVNLRFVSKHYGLPPEDVARMRANGSTFVKINGEAKKIKEEKQKQKDKKASKSPAKSYSKHSDSGDKGNDKKPK